MGASSDGDTSASRFLSQVSSLAAAFSAKRAGGPGSAAAAPPAATAKPGGEVERRYDTDGVLYTRQEFVEEYGGSAEWDKARRQQPAGPGRARRPKGRN